MSQDALLQDHLAQLNVIISRRNEFLRDLFGLLRSREDVNATPIDDEDERLATFLRRFDLRKGPELGSISNLTEDEFSFPIRGASSPRAYASSPTDVPTPTLTARTTRSRARAEEVAHFLPVKQSSSSERPTTVHASSVRLSQQDDMSQDVSVDTDEDELDLIGTSNFPKGGVRKERQENKPEARIVDSLGRTIDKSTPVDKHASPASVGAIKAAQKQSITNEMEVEEQIGALKNPEATKDKDDAMDAEEVEAITKPSDAEAAEHVSTSATNDREISGVPVKTAVVPSNNISQEVTTPPFVQVSSPLIAQVSPQKVTSIPTPSVLQEKLDVPEPLAQKDNLASYIDGQWFSLHYTLPPLSVLPADFTRKAKPIKRKKDKEREKERDRDRESKRDKDDTVPMGLSRWAATLLANPLWRKVSRANKTLSTREWSVAMAELRLIRTVERIELLKNDGRWSFRQPKKQRGIGGLVKSHWDYLLDEMKWMRTDFREERRWKMALAYNLSTAVLEWHHAKTPEERHSAGIVVKWRRPQHGDDHTESAMDMSLEDVDMAVKSHRLLGLDYSSEEEEEESEKNQGMDPLESSVAIRDALDSVHDIQPKNEDNDDHALQLVNVSDTAHPTPDPNLDEDPKQALKSTSDNPLLSSKSSSQSVNGDGELSPVAVKLSKTELASLREAIVHTDDLFFDLRDNSSQDPVPQHLDLHALFPDLQPFGLREVSGSPIMTNSELKRKSEKKSDRDDPAKRAEDFSYTKLYPTGRFMHTKPTLIGPLHPAKRFKDGSWCPIDPQPITADTDSRVSEDINNDLFDGRPSNTSSNLALQFHASSFKDKDARKRAADHIWTASDDALLKQLVDRYSTNWGLVAECYNSTRLTTPTEKRTPADCAERWKERWGTERRLQISEVAPSGGEEAAVASSSNQMTTRAVKRLASSSVSGAQGVNVAGEKKRRRHYLLQESIKRTTKKRADSIKMMANQRKPPSVHETHNQYNKLPKLTPLELARMKGERDQRENHDIQLARRRQEEAMRQNLLREQAQRGGILHAAQGPAQQQQAQPAPTPQSQAQQGQSQQVQQALTQQQQLTQLQQLQAQQQANQSATRVSAPAVVLPNRPTRMAPGTNARPVNAQAQAQLLQQARAMQVPLQLPPGAQANLAQVLSQAQAAGNSNAHLSGNPYYPLPANLGNLTQEQILNAFVLQTGQHSQQQQQHQSPSQNS